jgi:hypothetical protein
MEMDAMGTRNLLEKAAKDQSVGNYRRGESPLLAQNLVNFHGFRVKSPVSLDGP